MKKFIFIFLQLFLFSDLKAEDGYRLWLRYDKINNPRVLEQYLKNLSSVEVIGNSPTINIAKEELISGLSG